MHRTSFIRSTLACLLAAMIACPPSYGLVSIDDGKNRFFVNAGVSYTYDSNIF